MLIRVKHIVFLLFSLAFVLQAKLQAQTIEQPIIKVLNGAKGQIKKDSLVMVEDDKWWNPSEKTKLDTVNGAYRIKNIISLKLREDTAVFLKPQFRVSVKIKLYVTRYDGSVDSSLTPFLSIDFDTAQGAKYNSQSVFTLYNAYRITAKIMAVDSTYDPSGANTLVTPFLRLENEMQITREYNFNCDAAIDSHFEMSGSVSTTGELEIAWEAFQGTTEYDLEWAYIDNESLSDPDLYKTAGDLDAKKIFTDNASRVTVTGNTYKIPMLYDDAGTMFVRFRPVQNKPNGQRYEGKWNSDGGELDKYENFPGHETLLNWQATTSFAEEGKRKSVVQYYDGTLRSRQTVTKDNTTNTTVVAETMYDFQGRPVIQVLPAPTLSSLIGYSKNFNKGINGGSSIEYTKNLYDTLYNPGDYCQTPAPPMSTDTGASKYYSSNNPLVSLDFNKFIPDAHGYAFTETRYTQDNTGRVLSQSGVDSFYKIGSGHETKYFYGNPSQKELNGLFGTEVGYASHYFKNMVRDANGQYSVSYIDMHGRTIATALAGKAPPGMDSLPSYNKVSTTEKLSDSTNNITKDLVMESSRSLLVTDSGSYVFHYSLSPDSLRLKNCLNNNICYDCLYNLEITITDECNNCHLPGNVPYIVVDSNFTFATIDTLCDSIHGFNKTFTVGLSEGNYTITKKLSISKYGLSFYRDSVFMKKNTCKTFNDFYKEVSDSIRSQMDCSETSCDSCTARTDSLSTFRVYFLNSAGISLADSAQYRDDIAIAYEQAKEECKLICGNIGEHTYIRKFMLLDMTVPFGQYANPDSAMNANSYGNVFWQNPSTDSPPAWRLVPVYHDEYGHPDSIYNSAGILVPPNDVSISQAEFVANFKDVWAKDLLPYHIEYPKLIEYEKYNSSHLWDEKFGLSNTYADANSKGYLNPVNLNSSHRPYPQINTYPGGLDPLPDSVLGNLMPSLVYEYYRTTEDTVLSMWGMASITAKCPNSNSCGIHYINDSINNCFNGNFCTGELDMAWRSFREMYLRSKREALMSYLDHRAPAIHASIPLYRIEYFAARDEATNNYILSILGQNSGYVLSGANNQVQEMYQSTCEAYAASWWTNLAPCNLTSADSLKLIPRMVQICVQGSDYNHPFGSSSTAPGSTLTYKSFEALIHHYIDSMHAVNPTQYNYDIACNAGLIYSPMPYNQQVALAVVPIWTKPDSCQCSRVTTLYNQYKQYGSSDTSFAAYLLRQTGTVMTDADLNKLRNMCAEIDTCKFLTSPITLPPVLQCGITDVCVTCTQVRNAFDSFKVVFPNTLPAYNEDDSLQALKNRAFTNYMNHRFGFTKQAVDYLTFMDNCPVQYVTDSVKCDSLKLILSNYQHNYYNSHSIHADSSGCDTTYIKINNGGWQHDPRFRLSEWIKDGIYSMPQKDTLLAPTGDIMSNFNYVDTLCTNNNFTFQSRFRLPTDSQHYSRYVDNGGYGGLYGTLFYEFHFNNNIDVAFWIAKGSVFHPGHIDSMYAYIIIDTNGVNVINHRNISTGLKTINNWADLKAEFKNGVGKFYINGQLLDIANYNRSFSQFYQMAVDPFSYDLQIDWIKMFDTANNIKYFEDFLGCDDMAKQTIPRNCDSCQVNFVSYFNSLKGTSYNFSQIDSIYYNNCGIHPNPCTDDPKNCSELKQVVKDWYLTTIPTAITYDSNGVEKNVWSLGQDYTTRDWSQYNIKDFVRNGYLDGMPDSSTSPTSDYAVGYSIPFCPGNNFTMEYRIRLNPKDSSLNNLGLEHLFAAFFDTQTALAYFNSVYAHYSGFNSPLPQLNNPAMVQSFLEWKIIRFEFKNNYAYAYVDNQLVGTVKMPGNYYQLGGFSFSNRVAFQIDWLKMYDAQGNLKFLEDFEDYTSFTKPPFEWICPNINCSSTFTTFFNNRFGTNLTYPQITKLYQACGVYMQPCGLNESLLCGKTDPIFPPVIIDDPSPCADSSQMIFVRATELYHAYLDSLKGAFDSAYLKKCMQAFKTESFNVTHPCSEYHYTLYYYDQAGNLVKTVPPEGVDLSHINVDTWTDSVDIYRKAGNLLAPSHGLQTNYRYNTLNQVVTQITPDAGLSRFWYDRLGRLVISQNSKQAAQESEQYSYTKYDVLGRIKEVGQVKNYEADHLTQSVSQDKDAFSAWFNMATGYAGSYYYNIEQVTRTYYDNPYEGFIDAGLFDAKNLRNRVAYTSYTNGYDAASYNQAAFYSYDIHGNVDTLLQDYGQSSNEDTKNLMNLHNNRWKRMVYKYDLISGKVNSVAYQPNQEDAFYHRYSYDAENRLILAETSADSTVWEKDARYTYYKHGPLARTIIGQQQVQGIDYAYTLQGWLKGVNGISLTPANDMGLDGYASNAATKYIARDAYSFNLNYFSGDYSSINSGVLPFPGSNAYLNTEYRPLYNGNISSMAVNIAKFDAGMLYNYKYDQLNRLKAMDAYKAGDSLLNYNSWNGLIGLDAYKERVSYDANGNILTYVRHGSPELADMDSLTYNYKRYGSGKLVHNRLSYVEDGVDLSSYAIDIDNQDKDNYSYDQIGNLVGDVAEHITSIEWSVYGKILKITREVTDENKAIEIKYSYDAAGNRISKTVIEEGGLYKTTWYVRDASGNVMATYKQTASNEFNTEEPLYQDEVYLYGSSRLGSLRLERNVDIELQAWDTTYTLGLLPGIKLKTPFVRGNKQYELSNHLGNVLVTVSDKKIFVPLEGDVFDYYAADIITSNDYYPFGMMMPGRKYSSGNAYRYGFNGKENDNEVKGEGNSYDYGARIYDPRLGRWLSTDPLQQKYADLSPYQYCANSPISAKDPDGKVIIFINGLWGSTVGISQPLEPYWGHKWVTDVQNWMGDTKPALFYDGSSGGFNLFNHLKETSIYGNNNPDNRIDAGEDAGYKNAATIIGNLTSGETIKIVTNSMGAAFERGFTKGLLKYQAEENERRAALNSEIESKVFILTLKRGALMKSLDNIPIPRTSPKNEKIYQEVDAINSQIKALNANKKEILNVQIEKVIDLSSHQIDYPDPNAQKSYFMMAAQLNKWEKGFVDEKPIKGATKIGVNPNGTSQMSCHYGPCAPPSAFPK